MITFILAAAIAGIIVIIFFISIQRKRLLPPGPIRWPLIGNLLEIVKANSVYPHLAFSQLAKKYGNIMGLNLGMNYSVFLSGYDEMKEILKRAETIDARFEFPYVKDRAFNKNLGLIFATGDVWREMRRFTLKSLTEFGFGKLKTMDVLFEEETNAVLDDIQTSANANKGIWEVDSHYLAAITINVLWSFVAGERFNHNDEALLENLRLNDRMAKVFSHNNLYNVFPILKRICPKLVEHDVHMKTHTDMQDWMRSLIDSMRVKRSERLDTKAQSFVEVFLDEIEKHQGVASNFTEEQLIVILLDLFFAGAEITSMTLNWAILYLTLNPDKQEKLRNEIKKAKPTYTDRINIQLAAKIPYLTAVILESLRLGNPAPIAAPRLASSDIYYGKYLIPKGTPIYANVEPIFMDEKIWGDPTVFRPERFLDYEGDLIPAFVDLIGANFGFGKRQCLGEAMARDSLNMFILAIFWNFTFETIPGQEPSAADPISAVTIKPRPYSVRVIRNEILEQ